MTQGTWLADTVPTGYTHTVAGAWNSSGANFTFTAGGSTILLSPTASPAITTKGYAVDPFFNLTLASGGLPANDLDVDGTLRINGGVLDVGVALHTIYAAGWNNTVGPGAFIERTGRVVLEGNGTLQSTGEEIFYELEKNGGTTTLSGDIKIRSLTLFTAGTIQDTAPGNTITLGDSASPKGGTWPGNPVTWSNLVGIAGYDTSANVGTVVIDVDPGFDDVLIEGATTYYDLTCTTPGVYVRFRASGGVAGAHEQTINGSFTFIGASGNLINLDSTLASAGPYANPPIANEQWELTINGSATIDWVDVRLSYANVLVTPGPNCVNGGDNYQWEFAIPILISYAEDGDGNGRLDRIRAQVAFGAQLSDNFGQLVVEVDGYTVTGFATGALGNDDLFDVLLEEKPYPDTSMVPDWRIVANPDAPLPGLFGIIGGAYVETGVDYTVGNGRIVDNAAPVLVYAATVADGTRSWLIFSEDVFAAGGTPITFGDFGYSGAANPNALTRLSPTGNGCSQALLDYDAPVTATEVVLGTTITIGAGQLEDAVANPILATAYNVSDVGLGLVEPLWALTALPQRDPLRGGIGRITDFDGSAFLEDRDITLQASILPAASAAGVADLELYFAGNVAYPQLYLNAWVPDSPPAALSTDDLLRRHPQNAVAAGTATQTGSSGSLRDFLLDSTDPHLRDGADIGLVFVTDTGLPCLRIPDPGDPRSARPWGFKMRDLRTQRGEATVTNNVINPLRGETAYVTYTLSQPGRVSVTVFSLSGDVVDVLYRGARAAGEYTTTWDGRNRGGRVVARGVYFIRIVGPGVDETRKVLVVK
jgi:hypothetical protein